MKAELDRIVKTEGLSKNVYEIVSKALVLKEKPYLSLVRMNELYG